MKPMYVGSIYHAAAPIQSRVLGVFLLGIYKELRCVEEEVLLDPNGRYEILIRLLEYSNVLIAGFILLTDTKQNFGGIFVYCCTKRSVGK